MPENANITSPTRAHHRLPIFYPSQIKLYLECPERYFRKYVERRRGIEPFSRDLARGIALHAVAAECFRAFRAERAFPIDVQQRVVFQLAQLDYPDDLDAARDDDARTVTGQVKWILSEFDGMPEIVGVEETLTFYYPGGGGCPACLLRAKVDLVLAHPDGTLEHVDFKGGRAQRDPIQEVMSRIVVGATYGERYLTIQTTTLFVAEQKRASEILAREACRQTWATIREAIAAVHTGESWKPSPSPFCATCPYFGNGCSIVPETGDSSMADWLDGDAAKWQMCVGVATPPNFQARDRG